MKGHLPCGYATICANDAKGTEYQSGEPREDALRVQYIDEIVKDPSGRAKADAEYAERTKGTTGCLVHLNRPSPQREEDSRERVRIGSRGMVPDVLEARE